MKFFAALTFSLLSLQLQAFTIGAYNIRNFDYDERSRVRTDKNALGQMLQGLNVDVLSVEEINNTQEFERFITTTLPGYDTELTRCGGAHGQKLGFVYNTKTVEMIGFTEDLSVSEPGTKGSCDSGSRPAAIAQFKIKATGQKFFGITVHLKSGSQADSLAKREGQFKALKKIVNDLKARTGVKDFYIAGDMNTTEYLSRGSDYKVLTSFVSELGMTDLSGNLKCSAYWWGGTDDGIEEPSLLDHVIATPGLMKTRNSAVAHGHCQKVSCRAASLKDLGISYEKVSDHCPITATIQ